MRAIDSREAFRKQIQKTCIFTKHGLTLKIATLRVMGKLFARTTKPRPLSIFSYGVNLFFPKSAPKTNLVPLTREIYKETYAAVNLPSPKSH